jgi:hypothetical protein
MNTNSQPSKPEYLSMILFGLVGSLYFANAGYSYFIVSKESADVMTDVALGIMFITIGITSSVSKKSD